MLETSCGRAKDLEGEDFSILQRALSWKVPKKLMKVERKQGRKQEALVYLALQACNNAKF